MATNLDLMKKVVAYVEGTQQHLQKQAKVQEKVAAAAPAIVEMLVAKGLLEPFQKAACIESLKDHSKTIEILKFAVQRINQSPPAMGKAEKTASAKPGTERQSDRAFLDRLYGGE